MQDSRRRSSLLESLKSPLMASNDLSLLSVQQSSSNAIPSSTANNNNSNNSSGNDNPFQLNTSIWQNASSPSNDGSFSTNSAVPVYSNATQFNRRASDFHQNYTTWNNNIDSVPEDWDLSPRKYSLDSYQYNTIPSSSQQQQFQQQNFQQHQHQQEQQPQQQFNQAYNNIQSTLQPQTYGYSNPGSNVGFEQMASLNHPQQNIIYPNESTPQLTQHYQALDFYFNNDPYNRVSINIESLNETSIESLMTQKATDGSQITLPKFPNNSQLPSQQLFLVSFKSGRIDCFYLPESSSLVLKVGDLVIVEADRGKDLGKIVKLNFSIDEFRLLKYLQFMEQQAAVNSFESTSSSVGSNTGSNANSNSNVPTLHFPKPILRLALSQEAFQLLTKLQDEEKAKKICQFKIESSPLVGSRENAEPSSLPATPQTSLSLSMSIIDAEYQFDRKKLIFYYKANHRIDFRDLVRDLFRIYKTRIWMCAVNSNQVVQSPPPEQTHLAQLSKIDMKALTSPILQQPTLYTNDFQQQQQQQQYYPQQGQQQSGFSGFNQNIWTSSSPNLPPQSSAGTFYSTNSNMNYNLPSSQGNPGHQNSISGMLSEPLYNKPNGEGNTVASGSLSAGGTSGTPGSFGIWN